MSCPMEEKELTVNLSFRGRAMVFWLWRHWQIFHQLPFLGLRPAVWCGWCDWCHAGPGLTPCHHLLHQEWHMVWCCHPTAWFPSGEQGHGALPAHSLQELQVGQCYCTRQGSHCPASLWRAKTGLSAHIHPFQTLILYKNCKQVIAIVHGSFSQVQLLCAEQRQGSSAHTHSPKVGGRSLLLYMIGFLPYNFSVGSRLSAHTLPKNCR